MWIDESLPKAAEAMESAAAQKRPLAPLLKKLCPRIYRQIVSDGQTPGLFSFWGRSVNIDENTRQTIVNPAILWAIGSLAKLRMQGRIVHAGLQHTYGYLFSLIETPFGAKRDRWVSEDWERSFGLDTSLLGPQPSAGTLLANLTWFLGKVVYRTQPGLLRRLTEIESAVARELTHYDFSRVEVRRLVETVHPGHGVRRVVRIITDLVRPPFPPTNTETMSALLIYSVQNGANAPIRLVTAFPIKEQTVRELKASARPGKIPVRLRYNAYLPGLFGRMVSGRRVLQPV